MSIGRIVSKIFIHIAAAAVASTCWAEGLSRPLPPQPLADALETFARSVGLQLVYGPEVTAGVRSPGAPAGRSVADTLKELLRGTGLTFEFVNESMVTILGPGGAAAKKPPASPDQDRGAVQSRGRAGNAALHLARAEAPSVHPDETEADASGVPEILVTGKKTLNVDIRRGEDDAQPYMVFSGAEIAASGAFNVEDFLRTRLPANAQQTGEMQTGGANTFSSAGRIDLRGLGTNQTLILVDGRRLPAIATGQSLEQPNINGIAPASIERIEVLPSTAGGIYGGGATGGVINIILKHDYRGFDLEAGYGNTFDSDVGRRQVNLTGGFSLEEGRTQVSLGAAHSDQNELLSGDRNFSRRGARQLLDYRPDSSFVPLIYGSTSNVFSTTGANLTFDDGRALDAGYTFVPRGYGGFATDNGAGLLANAGRLNLDDRTEALYQSPAVNSLSANVRRGFTQAMQAYVDFYRDRSVKITAPSRMQSITLAGSSAANPFQQDIQINLPLPVSPESRSEVENLRANAGVIMRLPGAWSASLDYGWARSSASADGIAAFSPVPTAAGLPVLEAAALRDLTSVPIPDVESLISFTDVAYDPVEDTLRSLALHFSGPLFRLPGGPATLSGVAERREETAGEIFNSNDMPPMPPYLMWYPQAFQDVQSYYMEMSAPLVSAVNPLPLVRNLELMAAVRRDEYETRYAGQGMQVAGRDGPFPAVTYSRGDLASTDTTFGVRYEPADGLTLRAGYGTGFLPPTLSYIKEYVALYPAFLFSTLTDPLRGGGPLTGDAQGRVAAHFGGNTAIQPEQSENLSFGFILTPRILPGLRLSVDYTRIRKADEISVPTSQFLIDNAAAFPDRIGRDPRLATDPAGWSGPIVLIDTTPINLARTDVRAFDFQLDYLLDSDDCGDFRFYLIGTRQTRFDRQALPGSAPVRTVGYAGAPLEWRGNFGIDWNKGAWRAGWNAQYLDDYVIYPADATAVTRSQTIERSGGMTVSPTQLYNDIYLGYRAGSDEALGGLLAGTEITLGIQNVLDRSPPVLGTLGYSSYGDPRLRRFTLTLSRHFGR